MRRTPIAAALAGCALIAIAAAGLWQPLDGTPSKRHLKPFGGDFWAHRVGYPTMDFSPAWYVEAKAEDAKIRSAVPAGEHARFEAARGGSPVALGSSQWTFLGPQPKLFGNYGIVTGRVNVLAVDPRSPDAQGRQTVFAATDGGGVWKSTDCCGAGTTWRTVTDQPNVSGIAIGELHIDPNNPDIVYAGTGDLRYGSFSFGTSGLLKSSDAGETWQVLGESVFNPYYPPSGALGFPQYQAIGKVRVAPGNSNRLVVGTKTGLFFSHDGGANWDGPCVTNPHSSQRQDITGLQLLPRSGGGTWVYAAVGTRGNPTPVQPDLANLGANGVYRTLLPASGCPAVGDWSLLATGWPTGTGNGDPAGKVLGRIELAFAPSSPETLYAMGSHATSSNVLGVWKTVDGGDNWTQVATTASVQSGGCSNSAGGGSQMWYDAHLTVDPNNANTVLLSGVDLFRSLDGGSTFQNITCGYGNGNVHVDHHFTAYLKTPSGWDSDSVAVGTDGGIYSTSNVRFGSGGTTTANRPSYISLNQTMGAIEFYSGDISGGFATSAQPGASGGAQDNGSSYARWTGPVGSPAQWTVRLGGDGIFTRIEPVNEQRWYWSSQNGNVQVSTSGPTSSPTSASPSDAAYSSDTKSFVMPFELYRYGTLDAPGSGCTTASGCGYMILGTNRVWETLSGGVPRSSWYPNSPILTKNTLGNRSFINQLAHAVKTPSAAIAGTNDGNVWYGHGLNAGSANSASWVNLTASNAVLPNRPVMDVALDVPNAASPGAAAIGYAALGGFDQNTPGQPGHIYQVVCQNHCASFAWRNISGNLPNIPANSVAFNPKYPQQVFAGTDWGLYFTNDAFAANPVWERFDAGLPKVMIWDMAIDRGFTTLAVFTRGRGAWAWPLPDAPTTELFANGFESP
jgi:hypothetical protein